MRELTGATRIRIKRPRPELTGDTRIRLNQVRDLKDWALEMAQDEAAPEGAVHHWSDGDHVKKNGKWVPVQNKKEITMSLGAEPVKEKSYIRNFIIKHNKGVFPETIEGFAKVTKSDIYKPGETKLSEEQRTTIDAGIKRLKELTGSSFKHVLILRNPKLAKVGTVAQMYPNYPDTIMINLNNNFWNNAEKRNMILQDASTKNIAHPFLHEEGHRRIKVKKETWDEGDVGKAFFMSKISMQSPAEFCAEYYAWKIAGEDIGEFRQTIVEDLFKKYGGEYDFE